MTLRDRLGRIAGEQREQDGAERGTRKLDGGWLYRAAVTARRDGQLLNLNFKEKMMIGLYCMVRSKNAGVFAGTITKLVDSTATLKDARRMWYWDGAASLSQLATSGTSKPDSCKFPPPVDKVMLFEVIEIIPITEAAANSIASVPEWKS